MKTYEVNGQILDTFHMRILRSLAAGKPMQRLDNSFINFKGQRTRYHPDFLNDLKVAECIDDPQADQPCVTSYSMFCLVFFGLK